LLSKEWELKYTLISKLIVMIIVQLGLKKNGAAIFSADHDFFRYWNLRTILNFHSLKNFNDNNGIEFIYGRKLRALIDPPPKTVVFKKCYDILFERKPIKYLILDWN